MFCLFQMVTLFQGASDVLSNFFPCVILWGGLTFVSSEHAYQFLKAWACQDDTFCQAILQQGLSAAEVKRGARRLRRIEVRAGWAPGIKREVMRRIIHLKYDQVPQFRAALDRSRGDILEAVPGDRYWSTGRSKDQLRAGMSWSGRNVMGRLLVQLRQERRRGGASRPGSVDLSALPFDLDSTDSLSLQFSRCVASRTAQRAGPSCSVGRPLVVDRASYIYDHATPLNGPLLTDAHLHLDLLCRDLGVSPGVALATLDGFFGVATSYCFPDRLPSAQFLAESRSDKVLICVGWHPKSANRHADFIPFSEAVERFLDLVGVVHAIGEIGLDYTTASTNSCEQMTVLLFMLRLARDRGLPVVIHCRNAFGSTQATEDCILALQYYTPVRIYLHCLDSVVSYQLWVQAFPSVFFGLNRGLVERSSSAFQALVEDVVSQPGSRFLFESDSPFLAPRLVQGRVNRPTSLAGFLPAGFLAAHRHFRTFFGV